MILQDKLWESALNSKAFEIERDKRNSDFHENFILNVSVEENLKVLMENWEIFSENYFPITLH